MASEISTIQSLKAVDAWIDVINANINGGVRTAFKSSRLKFGGSNTDVSRAGSSTSLPLQFPEPGLTTANTVIDFTQGAITVSTENSHLAIQGEGFFVLASPDIIAADGSSVAPATATTRKFLLTRDGEFRTNKDGLLVHSSGYFLCSWGSQPGSPMGWDPVRNGATWYVHAVYNDVDSPNPPASAPAWAITLTSYLRNNKTNVSTFNAALGNCNGILKVSNPQMLRYSTLGSTVFDFGYSNDGTSGGSIDANLSVAHNGDATILTKSLEASNASMTQSVPELSLAQKLFSALTKVLQTKQTNVDGVLNLVR